MPGADLSTARVLTQIPTAILGAVKAQRSQASSLRSQNGRWQNMPEPPLCRPVGEHGLFLAGALTAGLCFRYGSYMVWKELGGFSEEAVVPLGLYAGQLALNWAWPPLFFGSRQMGWVSMALARLLGPWRWPVEEQPFLGGQRASHPRWGEGLKIRGWGWYTARGQHLSEAFRGPVASRGAPSCFSSDEGSLQGSHRTRQACRLG